MITFDKKVEKVTYEEVIIHPGIYHAIIRNEGEYYYYKFIVREEEYDFIKVRNSEYHKQIVKEVGNYATIYNMELLFGGSDKASFITDAEFNKVFTETLTAITNA